MTTVSMAEARERLAELGSRARDGERVIVEQEGEGFFALVPVEDAEYMRRLEDEQDVKAILESRGQPSRPLEDVIRDMERNNP